MAPIPTSPLQDAETSETQKKKLVEQFFVDKALSGEVKHGILKSYLGAWFAILCRNTCRTSYPYTTETPQYSRLVYVDGFAGPGLYNNAKNGSPLLTYELVLDHTGLGQDSPQICLIFIEKDNANCTQLFENLLKMRERKVTAKNANNVQFMVINGEFATAMKWVISTTFEFPEDGSNRIFNVPYIENTTGSQTFPHSSPIRKFITETTPLFVFADPFGYNGKIMPMSLMKEILACSTKSELLVNVMTGFLRRFWSLDSRTKPINQLVGEHDMDASWKERVLAGTTTDEKLEIFLDYYYECLSRGIDEKLLPLKFEMRNQRNALSYHLFFTSRHPTGLDSMKVAMDKYSHSMGVFKFSGFKETKGDVEVKRLPIEILRDAIVKHFKESGHGEGVLGQNIIQFIGLGTNYVPKKDILRKALVNFRHPSCNNTKFHLMVYDFTHEQNPSVKQYFSNAPKPAEKKRKAKSTQSAAKRSPSVAILGGVIKPKKKPNDEITKFFDTVI